MSTKIQVLVCSEPHWTPDADQAALIMAPPGLSYVSTSELT